MQNILSSIIDFIIGINNSANITITLKATIENLLSLIKKGELEGKGIDHSLGSYSKLNMQEIYSNLQNYLERIPENKYFK